FIEIGNRIPNLLIQVIFWMNFADQYTFIMASVENPDFTFRRKRNGVAPQKIMRIFSVAWRFKTVNFAALRIYATENMLNQRIFSSCIHCLKHYKQRFAGVRIKAFL